MWGSLAFRFLPILISSTLAATLPQLFQKAKDEFRLGSYAAALTTLETLETESSRPGLQSQREALLPGLLFYRGASLAALGRPSEARSVFERFLSYQPNARLDPALYPKSVIAALESARESRARDPRGGEASTLAEAYRAFPRPDAGVVVNPGEDWADGPVRHLLSPREREDFARLSRSEVRAASQTGGSNADRQARIEQVTGPGTRILDAASNWIEVWHYLRENLPKEVPYQEVVFEFVTKQGYGKNVLQRDSAALATLARAVEAAPKGR